LGPESDRAQSYRFKGLYPNSIKSAREANKFAPKNAEPHPWLGDSLRLSGKCDEARTAYADYLHLSDFDSGLTGQLNYWVIGFLFGQGKKRRASQHDIWRDLRSLTYFGVCDCDKSEPTYLDTAINYCQKALVYDPADPFVHFSLGVAFVNRAKRDGNDGDLYFARQHFRRVIDINPDLDEAGKAKRNLEAIEKCFARN
jgi:tetratricopeptide (TPR) repeat protein